jgi:hypothetical protein
MGKFGVDRNGEIDEIREGEWEVSCHECGWVKPRMFPTYQEASIWFTWHLENACEAEPYAEKLNLKEKDKFRRII